MKKIIVTGASGFIGSNLLSYLLDQGYTVTAHCRSNSERIDSRARMLQGDITDFEHLKSLIDGHDMVFHCAGFVGFSASDYQQAEKINVYGTRNVLQACFETAVKKVIHLSACAVLGASDNASKILDENAKPKIPKSDVYAYSKLLAEKEIENYVSEGLDVSIANISTTYGAGDWHLNSGSIIKNIASGGMKVLPPGGTSYVSVKDLVRGLELVARKGKIGERYILSSENLSFSELVKRIESVVSDSSTRRLILPKFSLPLLMIPIWLKEQLSKKSETVNLMTVKILRDSFSYKYFSNEKAKRELGWQPEVSLEEAVREAVEFYRQKGLWS